MQTLDSSKEILVISACERMCQLVYGVPLACRGAEAPGLPTLCAALWTCTPQSLAYQILPSPAQLMWK